MFYKTKHKVLRAEHVKLLAENVKLLIEIRDVKGERDALASVVESYRAKEEEAKQVFEPVIVSEAAPVKKTRSKKTTSTRVDL